MNRPNPLENVMAIRNLLFLAIALLTTVAMVDPALAKKKKRPAIQVANAGTDHGSCGAPADPCRSISVGIDRAHATGWRRVLVHPGVYGDLAFDNDLLDAGDERLPIDVRGVRVTSSGGAGRTLIKLVGGRTALGRAASLVNVSDGGHFSGFTIVGARPHEYGLWIRAGSSASHFVVDGDGTSRGAFVDGGSVFNAIATRNYNGGFVVRGPGQIHASYAIDNANVGFAAHGSGWVVQDCQAIDNSREGFLLSGDGTAVRNLALGSGTDGFLAQGSGIELAFNRATGSGANGFQLQGSNNHLSNSTAAANRGHGIVVLGSSSSLERTRSIGNGLSGLTHNGGPNSLQVSNSAFYSNNVCQIRTAAGSLTLTNVYAGDSSRCRTTPYLQTTALSATEAVPPLKKKKKKGKKKKRTPTTAPWPLQR